MAAGVRTRGASTSSDVPVVQSRYFMREAMMMYSHLNMLRQDISKIIPTSGRDGKMMGANKKSAPIITVNDLSKTDGDEVEIRIRHGLKGAPTMCCDTLQGRGEAMTWAKMRLRIGPTRHAVDTGCFMDDMRLGGKPMALAQDDLREYYNHIEWERALYQLAGARGHFVSDEQTLLAPDNGPNSLFAKQMVNCVDTPSHCRHYYAGEATSFDGADGGGLTEQDVFGLSDIIKLSTGVTGGSHPIPPIDLGDGSDACYCLLVTPAQMASFKQSAGYEYLQGLQANAIARSTQCGGHPVFKGECFMYENIVVKQYNPPVRFEANKLVKIANPGCEGGVRETMHELNGCVDRAILLGGQALAEALGSVRLKNDKTIGNRNFAFTDETFDHGARQEIGIAWMSGMRKIRFAGSDGCSYDRGVAVLDSFVKCPEGGC